MFKFVSYGLHDGVEVFKPRNVCPAVLDSPFLRKQKFRALRRRLLSSASLSSAPLIECVLIDSYIACPEENYNELSRIHFTEEARWSDAGQTFTTPASPTYKICKATFKMGKLGSPTGHVKAYLYATDADGGGGCGTTAIPDGAPLAVSDAVDIADLPLYEGPGDMIWITFTFTAGQQVELSPNSCYAICVAACDGSLDDDNAVIVNYSDGNEHAGAEVAYFFGHWESSGTDYEECFTVYGIEV